MKFIIRTYHSLSSLYRISEILLASKTLNENFPAVLFAPLSITFPTFHENAVFRDRAATYFARVDFVTDGVLIWAECISCGDQKKKRSQRRTFADVSRLWDVDQSRLLPARKETRAHSLRDRLFINANTSSNWRGATGTVKYLNTKYLKWVASRFQSLSWSKLPRNATLFDSM